MCVFSGLNVFRCLHVYIQLSSVSLVFDAAVSEHIVAVASL